MQRKRRTPHSASSQQEKNVQEGLEKSQWEELQIPVRNKHKSKTPSEKGGGEGGSKKKELISNRGEKRSTDIQQEKRKGGGGSKESP